MTMTETKVDHGQANAAAWYETIKEQLEALQGWDKAARDAGWESFHDKFNVLCWKDTDGMTWAGTAKQLCAEFDILPDDRDIDAAMTEIQEGPLSVMVRDGWRQPGAPAEDSAEEFEILLSTGGPALRIWGTLRNGQPDECELQHQDWGTPWTKWVPEPYDPEYRDTLSAYAACFYFGD